MTNVNISKFRENLYSYIKNAIDFNDLIEINTKNGRAIVMSEEEYTGLIETLYLNGSKKTMDDIMTYLIETKKEADKDTLDEALAKDALKK